MRDEDFKKIQSTNLSNLKQVGQIYYESKIPP